MQTIIKRKDRIDKGKVRPVHERPVYRHHTDTNIHSVYLYKPDGTIQRVSDVPSAWGFPYAAIDAEWQGRNYLTRQMCFFKNDKPDLAVVIWHGSVLPGNRGVVCDTYLVVAKKDTDLALLDVVDVSSGLKVFMFYSPKDPQAMLGEERWREVLVGTVSDEKGKRNLVSKKRNITGEFDIEQNGRKVSIKLQDFIGAFNSSLEKAISSVNLKTDDKVLSKRWAARYHNLPVKHLSEWCKDGFTSALFKPMKWDKAVTNKQLSEAKGRMQGWLESDPNTFLSYSLGDVVIVPELLHREISMRNQVLRDALGSHAIQFTIETFPWSMGSCVSKTLEHWMISRYPKATEAAMWLSLSKIENAEKDLKNALKQDDLHKRHQKLKSNPHILHGWSQGAIEAYYQHSHGGAGSSIYGAIVMGGRCLNEDVRTPGHTQVIEEVIDIDLSSCYGSKLKEFTLPLGLPTIYQRKRHDDRMTLGEFLNTYQHELVPGLFTIYVRGVLGFEQDVLFSKLGLNEKSIARTILSNGYTDDLDSFNDGGRTDEVAHLGGDFKMLTMELENAIITQAELDIIQRVATNNERKEMLGLEVITAVYYPRSLRCETEEDFTKKITEERGWFGDKMAKDTRSRAWFGIPLEGFVGEFLKYRKQLKKGMKKEIKDSAEYNRLDALQTKVKLFVNTTYGILASPYFPVGNTVVANNITAAARMGAWKMSKALLTVQSITDGGMFSRLEVAYLKPGSQGKPGLHVLADRKRLKKHRSITTAPLTDEDVLERFRHHQAILKSENERLDRIYGTASKSLKQEWLEKKDEAYQEYRRHTEVWLDNLCTEHIKAFWSQYGLELGFDIECKYDNLGRIASYLSASDYCIQETLGGGETIKTRGAKEDNHPKKQILRWMIAYHRSEQTRMNPEEMPKISLEFHRTSLIGVSEYQKCPTKYDSEGLLPGDEQQLVYHPKIEVWGRSFKTREEWRKFEDAKRKNRSNYDKRDELTPYGILKEAPIKAFTN